MNKVYIKSFYLLGLIYEKQQKFQEAKDFFKKALEMNPTLWTAYEKLCKMGEQIPPHEVFNDVYYKLLLILLIFLLIFFFKKRNYENNKENLNSSKRFKFLIFNKNIIN